MEALMIDSISDFGEIKSITLTEKWDLEKQYRLFVEKGQNEQTKITPMLYVDFPTEICATVEYENYILEWSCFETKEFIEYRNSNNLTYESLLNSANLFSLWNNALVKKIEINQDKENYCLEIFGLKFFLGSLMYKKLVNET
jgi:hypothetical protein